MDSIIADYAARDWQCRAEDILVAVPTLNEEGAIEACLRSLLDGDPSLRQMRIVVADGGSTDRTREIVTRMQGEFPNIDLLDNPDRLQSAAINRVAEAFGDGYEIIVRADAHAVYPPDYVLQVADSLVRQQADSVVVSMDSVGDRNCMQKAAAWVVDTPLGSGGSAHRGGRVSRWIDHGHHAAMRVETFRKVGGYDPKFSHNEDAELDHRIREAGGRIWLDAEVRLDYEMRPSFARLARQYWNYGRGRARTILKHRMKPRLRQLIPAINLVLIVVSLVLSLVSPVWLFWPLLYLAVLVAASVWIARKHGSACGLLAGVAVAVMHNAWGAGFLQGLWTQRGRV